MNDILQLINVTKDFRGFRAINGVNLNIVEGAKHALIGPNGAGKTTIFNLITGKYNLSNGRILFKGRRIDGFSAHKISQCGIARSFQVINVFKGMTVFENLRNAIVSRHRCNLESFRLLRNMDTIKKEVDFYLEIVNLREFKNDLAENLGYGQQRRLEIGLTIALDPELVLLDEPTAGMTREETADLVGLIKEITDKKTLFIIEHDMELVFNLADRISVLQNGQVIADGNPETIKSDPMVREAYLGVMSG